MFFFEKITNLILKERPAYSMWNVKFLGDFYLSRALPACELSQNTATQAKGCRCRRTANDDIAGCRVHVQVLGKLAVCLYLLESASSTFFLSLIRSFFIRSFHIRSFFIYFFIHWLIHSFHICSLAMLFFSHFDRFI